ncbi:MAG: type II secretion system F family protein [Anaerolineales bacterium]
MPDLLLIGFLGAVLLLAIGLFVTLRGESSLVERRLEQYLEPEKGETTEDTKENARSAILTNWITQRVETTKYGERISRELARADLKLKTGEYIALIIISSVLTGFFGYMFGGESILFAIVGLIVGPFIPRFVVRYLQRQRLHKFNDQLPDTLNLMVNSLRSGFSALQAMQAVSQELPSPISDEFRRVVQEMQLGVPMEGALDNMERRIASDDLDLVVTAVNIQREVGGNLAEILDTISYTIRERIRIQGEVRATTAQVAFSGKFMAVMPILLSAVLWALNREYMMQFFEEPIICGLSLLIVAGVMLVSGYFILTRIAKVEI